MNFVRRMESDIFPAPEARPIAEFTAPELLAVLRKVEGRGACDLAHRLAQMCGAVFRYGIADGVCERDVAADLRGALTPHKKRHHPAVRREELPELMSKIARYDCDLGITCGILRHHAAASRRYPCEVNGLHIPHG